MISDLETNLSSALDTTVGPSGSDPRELAPVLLFCIPPHEDPEFQSLPDLIRKDTTRLLLICEKIHAAKNIEGAIKQHAVQYGLGYQSLRRKYYAYAVSGMRHAGRRPFDPGDWRIFVNYAKVPKRSLQPATCNLQPATVSLSSDFISFLQGLMQSNQRKSEPAIRLLYRMWKRGDSIPGYGTWQEWFLDQHPHEPLPEHCPPDFPVGWSKGNLRKYIPEAAELALARQGIAAARNHLPPILTTREGLRPLECIMFDDVKTDFKIMTADHPSPVDLNLLVAMDVATGMILRFGLRPAVPRLDGVKDKLKLADMKILIAGLILQYGIPKNYPMNLIVENQTATVREGTAAALAELGRSVGTLSTASPIGSVVGTLSTASPSRSGPGIEVSRTMMIQGTALFAGYRDRSLGNPSGKAALESTFNLLHNEAGFLPGQVGRRYDSGPAELHGRTREAESLSRTRKHLTPHQRAELRYPFLNYQEARLVLTDIWNRIIHRTDHRMEAFQCVAEFRLAGTHEQWRPDADLTLDPRLSTLDPSDPRIEWRNPARKESPFERWERLCGAEAVGTLSTASPSSSADASPFLKLHPAAIARLYDEAKPVTIRDAEIAFDHDKQTCVYRLANLQFSPATFNLQLSTGTKCLAYFDPQDLSWIHLTDGSGGYLGSIPRTRGLKRFDQAALKVEMDRRFNELRELQSKVSARMPELVEQRLADTATNLEVLTDALAHADVIDVAQPADREPSPARSASEPEYSVQINQARYATAVTQRQAAAKQIPALDNDDDGTAELLAADQSALCVHRVSAVPSGSDQP